MNNKKRKKKTKRVLSPEMKRRQRIAQGKIASFFGVLVLCAGIFFLVRAGENKEVVLNIDAADYECIMSQSDAELEDDETESVELKDEAAAETAMVCPKLEEAYPIDMEITSEYAVVYDVEADKILYAKNPEEKCYPASTTKILSSAVILNNVPSDFVFTVGDELDMVNPESSLAFLTKGCQLDTEMMVDALMLPSGNDAAYAAAANVGRVLAKDDTLSPQASVQAFVDEMNRTAQLIGCTGTHFTAPDGFHDDEHYTTVMDMLKITLYAEKFDMLTASAAKTNRYVTLLSGEELSWENSNKLIHSYSDCYYTYATGMKTGMTDQAGYCVVATAERFDHQIICIVFGADASDIRWNDTIALLDAAFVNVRENRDNAKTSTGE